MKLVFLFFVMSTTIYCQNILKIRVVDQFSKPISNCHIENMMTKEIVISDNKGYFQIKTGIKDPLKFSHLQYKSKLIRTWKIKESIFDVVLESEVFLLPQVAISNKLTGNLYVDTNRLTQDTIGAIIREFKEGIVQIDRKVITRTRHSKDERHLMTPKSFVCQSFRIKYDIDKSTENLEIKSLDYKSRLANNILNEFGKGFFFNELKIPIDKYYLFIQYCISLGIEVMYKKEDVFGLIKLFTIESKNYVKLIEK